MKTSRNPEKQTLLTLCKYCEALNRQLADTDRRLRVLETAMQSSPELANVYNLAAAGPRTHKFPPSLRVLLGALRSEVEKIGN